MQEYDAQPKEIKDARGELAEEPPVEVEATNELSEHDLEFILQPHDTVQFIGDKQKQDFANDWLYKLDDYGFDKSKCKRNW